MGECCLVEELGRLGRSRSAGTRSPRAPPGTPETCCQRPTVLRSLLVSHHPNFLRFSFLCSSITYIYWLFKPRSAIGRTRPSPPMGHVSPSPISRALSGAGFPLYFPSACGTFDESCSVRAPSASFYLTGYGIYSHRAYSGQRNTRRRDGLVSAYGLPFRCRRRRLQ